MSFDFLAPSLTAMEAAVVRGVSYRRILRAVRSGELPAQHVRRVTIIARDDLDRWSPAPARQNRAVRDARLRQEAHSRAAAPLHREQGGLAGALAALWEGTEYKRGGPAMCEQTALLEATIESMPDGVVITDELGRVRWCNPVVTEIMGQIPEDAVDRMLHWEVRDADGEPLPPEDAPALRALRGEQVRNLLVSGRRPDGRVIWARTGASAIRAPDGSVRGAVVVMRDVTQEEQGRQSVARERSRLKVLIESSPEGIIMADIATGTIELCNAAAERLLGRPELKGVRVDEYGAAYHLPTLDGHLREGQEPALVRSLQGETCRGLEKLVVHPNGRQTPVLVNSAPLRDERGAIIGAIEVLQDITERKEQERRRDAFLSMATHELRSPLTVIRGHLQLLQRLERRTAARQDTLEHLAVVLEQTDRLGSLIAELLDLSRLQLGRLEVQRAPTDLTALAAHLMEHVKVTAPAHRFRLESPGPVVGNWDAFRLEQALTNLLTNAVKYSPARGTVTLTISIAEDQPDFVEAAVHDEGIGIPPGQEEAIFHEFWRADNTQQQTRQSLGLGLYIARGIVERHGGKVWAESAGQGKGSTFHVRLPR